MLCCVVCVCVCVSWDVVWRSARMNAFCEVQCCVV